MQQPEGQQYTRKYSAWRIDGLKLFYDYQIWNLQEYGGVSRYHFELYRKIKEQNEILDPNTISFFPKNRFLCDYMQKKICIPKIKQLEEWVLYFNILMSIFYLHFHKIDILHPTWYHSYIHKYFLKRNKVKLVYTVYDMIHELYMPDLDNEIQDKKRAIYSADKIVAISESTKKDILRFYPEIEPDKIDVIYLGTSHLPEAKKPDGFNVPEKYYLYVGNRAGYKNAVFLYTSLADMLKNDRTLHIIYAGVRPEEPKEKEEIEALGISNQVLFVNVTDAELAYLYQHAICFIYPSLYEGFGLPILEAFDNSCPVLCSNISSMPEVGGDAALYFTPTKSAELVECVELITHNEEARNEYIRKGLERTKLFTWEKMVEQYKKLYLSLRDQ